MKKIAVLMTCYNRVNTTLECLRRLFAQKIPDDYSFDVWLVDDASPDMTGEIVKSSYPRVNIIRGTGKLFWCKGMRLAWEKAAGAYDYDFYLWLNDDVIVIPDFLIFMLSDISDIEETGVSTYVVSGACADSLSNGALQYGCYTKNEVFSPKGKAVPVSDEYAMSGNIVLVPKATYEVIGPIYGGYLHAYGDSDYREQMKKYGIPLYCASVVCGVCPQQPERYLRLEYMGLWQRVQSLFSPKGYPLHDTFIYRYRNWGLVRALVSTMHVLYLVFFTRWCKGGVNNRGR